MLLGEQIFRGMGIDPFNYMCINMATTGVKAPIGILEISGKHGESDQDFQYFLSPEGMFVPSDLNYAYTRIPRGLYDREVMDTPDFLDEMIPLMKERPPEIIIVNNEWWLGRIAKDKANGLLSPFFGSFGRIPVFSISYYETARAGMAYTIFSPMFEYCSELIDHIRIMKKQSSRDYACDVDCAYAIREGEEFPIHKMTAAQEAVKKMSFIWESILANNAAQEEYR